MIHLMLLGLVIAMAWILRRILPRSGSSWGQRWSRTLSALILPPLLVLITLVAILWMGPQGEMVGAESDRVSYGLACLLLGIAVGWAGILIYRSCRSIRKLRSYGQEWLADQPVRILDSSTPFAAQVGFWEPELLISQGLRTALTPTHLQAVLIHEQAHHHYRDTFWFFWLGWLRCLGSWLPDNDSLWQELLVLRELRADHWAAQQVDPLLLAEALLQVVSLESQAGAEVTDPACSAAILSGHLSSHTEATALDRIEERIQALLEGHSLDAPPFPPQVLTGIGLVLWPLLTIPFHS